MRRVLAALLIPVLVILVLAGNAAQADDDPDGSLWSPPVSAGVLPPMTLDRLAGGTMDVPGLSGRPVILHFWATWCGPCIEELPALNRLAGPLGSSGITVLAISMDHGGAADIRSFFARHPSPTHLEILMDSQGMAAHALGVTLVPTTIVIGADGRELARLTGAGAWEGHDGLHLVSSILRLSR